MDPATISLIVQFALQYGIPAARKLVELFHTEKPTTEQWEAVFAPAEKSYGDYIAEAKAKQP